MNYLFNAVAGGVIGGVIGVIFTTKRTKSKEKISQLEIEKNTLLKENLELKLELKIKVARNENDIILLKESDEDLRLKMSQCFEWFGSMIRHSAEKPFKKESIEKFLAEYELKKEEP